MRTKIICFRVDSSIEIGTGHVMRCLTLAEELKNMGADSVFICRPHKGNLISYIKSKGFEVKELLEATSAGANYGDLKHSKWLGVTQEDDLLQTKAVLSYLGIIDLFIIDHYAIDEYWEKRIRSIAKKVFVIDDLADRKHDCDYLLDQNFYINANDRYHDLINEECLLLLGPSYALLRDEFREIRYRVNKKEGNNRLLLFFGGIDFDNVTLKVIKAIEKFNKNYYFHVIIGKMNPNKVLIRDYIADNELFFFHCQVENIAEIMINCDMAICAGGSFTWERWSMGLPAIIISVADNQIEIAIHADRVGIDKYIGTSKDVSANLIIKNLEKILDDSKALGESKKRAMDLVDGRGAFRVAKILFLN